MPVVCRFFLAKMRLNLGAPDQSTFDDEGNHGNYTMRLSQWPVKYTWPLSHDRHVD